MERNDFFAVEAAPRLEHCRSLAPSHRLRLQCLALLRQLRWRSLLRFAAPKQVAQHPFVVGRGVFLILLLVPGLDQSFQRHAHGEGRVVGHTRLAHLERRRDVGRGEGSPQGRGLVCVEVHAERHVGAKVEAQLLLHRRHSLSTAKHLHRIQVCDGEARGLQRLVDGSRHAAQQVPHHGFQLRATKAHREVLVLGHRVHFHRDVVVRAQDVLGLGRLRTQLPHRLGRVRHVHPGLGLELIHEKVHELEVELLSPEGGVPCLAQHFERAYRLVLPALLHRVVAVLRDGHLSGRGAHVVVEHGLVLEYVVLAVLQG
mmetsp:Transcript_75705/g.148297  ORF Transcript_75705/g.148297 Transcript_75705/m.148297 type:complete len:314 (+) Transcript_75705:1561-2502(+)